MYKESEGKIKFIKCLLSLYVTLCHTNFHHCACFPSNETMVSIRGPSGNYPRKKKDKISNIAPWYSKGWNHVSLIRFATIIRYYSGYSCYGLEKTIHSISATKRTLFCQFRGSALGYWKLKNGLNFNCQLTNDSFSFSLFFFFTDSWETFRKLLAVVA